MSGSAYKRSSADAQLDDAPSPPIKISQRAPKRYHLAKFCTECIRRKTRCNKQIPCEPCLKRKVGLSCRLESQYIHEDSGRSPNVTAFAGNGDVARHLLTEIEALKQRISDLERSSQTPRQLALAAERPFHRDPMNEDAGGDEKEQDAGTTLEYLALGLDRRLGAVDGARRQSSRHCARDTSPTARPLMIDHEARFSVPESVTDVLLPQETVATILAYAESRVLWQHCCIHPPSFNKEVTMFWRAISESDANSDDVSSGWSSVEPTWIALLYVVMGISVHQMDREQAQACGLSEADQLILPNAFISAAEDAFYAGSFMTRPSLWTVQAIAILSLCGHNVCDSDLLSSLLAMGIKMAQTLGLHSLGRRSRVIEARQSQGHDLSGPADVAEVIDVEIGKRIWWALVLEDWFAIPFRGVWAIHPDQMDTPMPHNCHSEDLQIGRYKSRDAGVVTIALKHRFSAQMAAVLQQVFHQLRTEIHNAVQIVEEASAKIDNLLRALPSSLRPLEASLSHQTQAGAPPYIPAMRHYIQISARHKLLVINRAFLAHHGPPDARARAHKACVQNAQAILQELDRGQQPGTAHMQSLWTIPYHSVAAAVVLALDMIRPGDGRNTGSADMAGLRAEINRAFQALERLAPTSRIARRGLQVLTGLVKEIDALSYNGDRRGSLYMDQMVTSMEIPSNDMIAPSAPGSHDNLPGTGMGQSEINGHGNSNFPGVGLGIPSGSIPYEPVLGIPNMAMASQQAASDSHHWQYTQTQDGQPLFNPHVSSRPSFDDTQSWSQEDVDRILSSLQETLPDVGRLFDGSIGMF